MLVYFYYIKPHVIINLLHLNFSVFISCNISNVEHYKSPTKNEEEMGELKEVILTHKYSTYFEDFKIINGYSYALSML